MQTNDSNDSLSEEENETIPTVDPPTRSPHLAEDCVEIEVEDTLAPPSGSIGDYARYCVVLDENRPDTSEGRPRDLGVMGPKVFGVNGGDDGYSAWLTAAEAAALREQAAVRAVIAMTADDVPLLGDPLIGINNGPTLLIVVAPNGWQGGCFFTAAHSETYLSEEELAAQWSEQYAVAFEQWTFGVVGVTFTNEDDASWAGVFAVVAQLREHPQVAGLMWVPARNVLAPAYLPHPCPWCGMG